MDLEHVWHQLQQGVPPEVTHYHQGHHPGVGWWLKTVIPTVATQPNICAVWQALQQRYPNLIQLVPWAYDWHACVIEQAQSVWIVEHKDVMVTYDDPEFHFVIQPADQSHQTWGKLLHTWIQQSIPQSTNNLHMDDWHNLTHVAQLLQAHQSDHQARSLRATMEIVNETQNSSKATG